MKIDIGTIRGANNPSEILNENRAFGWKLFAWFLAACSVQALGWLVWVAR